MERCVGKMDLSCIDKSRLVLVHDCHNLPSKIMLCRTAHIAIGKLLGLLNNNYPEMAAKHIIINAPTYITVILNLMQPFITKKTSENIKYCGYENTKQLLIDELGEENVPSQYLDGCPVEKSSWI